MSDHAQEPINPRRGRGLFVAGAVMALLSISSAYAAGADSTGDASSRYRSELAACTNGSSQQDHATCLKEAGAARDEARHGRLGTGSVASESNATARCKALPAKDRDDCIARINGAGTTSGSVREGGIYRELVTTTPAPAMATPPSAPQQ